MKIIFYDAYQTGRAVREIRYSLVRERKSIFECSFDITIKKYYNENINVPFRRCLDDHPTHRKPCPPR